MMRHIIGTQKYSGRLYKRDGVQLTGFKPVYLQTYGEAEGVSGIRFYTKLKETRTNTF